MNQEIPEVQPGFRKGRGTRDLITNICWIIEKAKEFQKNIYFWFTDYTKAFDYVDHNKLWFTEKKKKDFSMMVLGQWGIYVETKWKQTPTVRHTMKQLQVGHRHTWETQINILLEDNVGFRDPEVG